MSKKEIIDIGDTALCDMCGKDYTGSPATGGFLFGSNGVCPECAPDFEAGARKYHEEHHILDRARPGETFQQACIRWRGGNNTIVIEGFDAIEEMIGRLDEPDGSPDDPWPGKKRAP